MNKEPDTMKALLANTVYMLCKDGFSFTRRLTIKGLIVVSVDDEAFVVQMDKKFCHSPNGDVVAVNNHANGDNEEDVDDSIERLRVFCEDAANSTQIEEEFEDGVSEDQTQDQIHRMDVSRQSDMKVNQTVSESQGKLSGINNDYSGSVDMAQNFLENFSGSDVVKLEVASDNEDANELLASINADYNSYLEVCNFLNQYFIIYFIGFNLCFTFCFLPQNYQVSNVWIRTSIWIFSYFLKLDLLNFFSN